MNGHIRISCVREPIDSYKDRKDWQLHILPIKGGIQETDNLYQNTAPESGYQSEINVAMVKGQDDYQHQYSKQYYFYSNEATVYGSMQIEVEPFASIEKQACSIRINAKINPTGSRNLELKHSNTSQPQLPTAQKLARNLN